VFKFQLPPKTSIEKIPRVEKTPRAAYITAASVANNCELQLSVRFKNLFAKAVRARTIRGNITFHPEHEQMENDKNDMKGQTVLER
jgi:hypothetical protein